MFSDWGDSWDAGVFLLFTYKVRIYCVSAIPVMFNTIYKYFSTISVNSQISLLTSTKKRTKSTFLTQDFQHKNIMSIVILLIPPVSHQCNVV